MTSLRYFDMSAGFVNIRQDDMFEEPSPVPFDDQSLLSYALVGGVGSSLREYVLL